MKSYIWLQTNDGSIQQVEEEVAMFCPVICREILQKSMGSSKLNAIVLPERVNPATLGSILDYCRFHQVPGHSIKVRCCGRILFPAVLWFDLLILLVFMLQSRSWIWELNSILQLLFIYLFHLIFLTMIRHEEHLMSCTRGYTDSFCFRVWLP